MAIFSETQLTKLGHELLAKVLSGQCQLHFEELWAGDGRYDGDVLDLEELVNPRLQGSIVRVQAMGVFTELEGLVTNEHLTSFLEFRELGVKAVDPDRGLILFAYTNAGDDADPIGPFNGVFMTEEQFIMRIYTANVAEITATIAPSTFATQISYSNALSGLKATTVQDAIDEHIFTSPVSEKGVHGIRYYDGMLQVWNGEQWITVAGGGPDYETGGYLGSSYYGSAYLSGASPDPVVPVQGVSLSLGAVVLNT
jgi:hypothetical protein